MTAFIFATNIRDGPLEAEFVLRIPGQLNRRGRCCLLRGGINGRSRGINWSLPAFISEAAVDFEILADALDGLKSDVAQRGSAGDKILGRFLGTHARLDPLIAAEVIRGPGLSALVFAADPVAEQLALVRITLPLHAFPVFEMSALAVSGGWIGIGCFGAQIELWDY